jgi:glycosyltransferase domain-containing protein
MQNISNMKKTALLIPSFRSEKQNLATLAYLASFANPELHVIISDCSLNNEKHDYLKKLSANNQHVMVLYQSTKYSLHQDMVNLLDYAIDYKYTAVVPDDDYVTYSYIEEAIKVLDNNPECVCSYGNYIIYQSNGNAFRDSRDSLDNSPINRIKNGFNPNYFNTMFFSVSRRSAMQPWVNYCKNHCMIAAFFDFLHCISMMAQGKIMCHQKGHFLWIGENWDTPEKNAQTRASYYRQTGLNEDFCIFHDLHFGVEGVMFINGKDFPMLNAQAKKECAEIIWNICMTRFKQALNAQPEIFNNAIKKSDQAVGALNYLLQPNICHDPRLLEWFLIIVECFSLNLSQSYRNQILLKS